MEDGEQLIIRNKDIEIMYFEPCVMDTEKLRVRVKIKKKINYKELFSFLEKNYQAKISSDPHVASFTHNTLTYLVFESNDVNIGNAKNKDHIFEGIAFLRSILDIYSK